MTKQQFFARWQIWWDRPFTQYLLLANITLLALALRFYKLGEWSFWIDEISTIAVVQDPLVTYNITWPRVSLMLISETLKILDLNEWSARLVPAIIGVISIPILYFPIRRMFGRVVALMAMLLLAVAPWHIYWSQNARFYTILLLLYALAAFAFYFALERDQPWYLVLFFLLLFWGMIERFVALVFVPVLACYLLLLWILPFEKPPGLRARNLLLLLGPCLAFGAFEVYRYFTAESSSLADVFAAFAGKPVDDPFRLLIFIGYNLGFSLMSFAFFSGIYLLSKKNRAGLFLFLSAVVPVILLVMASPFVFTQDRYVFVTLPSWIILASVGVKEIFVQPIGQVKIVAAGLLILLLADAVSANVPYYTINHGNRLNWEAAFSLVQTQMEEDDGVVSTRDLLGTYYLDKPVTSFLDVDVNTIERGEKKIWFVVDSTMVWNREELKRWLETNTDLIDVHYLRIPQDINLRIYLYDPEHDMPVE